MATIRSHINDKPPYTLYGPYRTFSREAAEPLVPGEVAELSFDLWATSVLIKKGHRIRVAIAGADKDNFARYPPIGEPTWTVERNRTHASKIVLPVKRQGDQKKKAGRQTGLDASLGSSISSSS